MTWGTIFIWFSFILWDKILLCSLGWPWTHYIARNLWSSFLSLSSVGITGLWQLLQLGCIFLTSKLRWLLLTHSFLSLLLLVPISWGIEPILFAANFSSVLLQSSPLLSYLYSRLVFSNCEVSCPSILISDLSVLSCSFSGPKTYASCCPACLFVV